MNPSIGAISKWKYILLQKLRGTFYKNEIIDNSYYDCCVVVKGLHSGLPKQTIFVRKIKEKENCYDNLCVTYNVKSQQKNRNPYQHWQ